MNNVSVLIHLLVLKKLNLIFKLMCMNKWEFETQYLRKKIFWVKSSQSGTWVVENNSKLLWYQAIWLNLQNHFAINLPYKRLFTLADLSSGTLNLSITCAAKIHQNLSLSAHNSISTMIDGECCLITQVENRLKVSANGSFISRSKKTTHCILWGCSNVSTRFTGNK